MVQVFGFCFGFKIIEFRVEQSIGVFVLLCIYFVCDCCYNQGIWYQKSSFGFFYQRYRESRNRDLKQNYRVNIGLGFIEQRFKFLC